MVRENKLVKETEIIHLGTSIESCPTNDFVSKISTIEEQRKYRIDILIKDEDIIPGAGEFYIPGSDRIYFSISERLYKIFNKIFNWYAELGIDKVKEVIDVSLEKLQDAKAEKEFLSQKLTEEVAQFDDLIKSEFFREIEIIKQKEHKNYWFYFIENEHLFNLICYLKFDMLNGEKITEDFFDVIPFGVFENFFISDSLKIAYEGMRIEKRIEILQNKIDELSKTIQKDPTHRILAIIHKYKEDTGYEKPLTRSMMREIGGKNREKAFDTIGYLNGVKKGTTYRAISVSELETVIKLLDGFPLSKKKAIIDLENLRNS